MFSLRWREYKRKHATNRSWNNVNPHEPRYERFYTSPAIPVSKECPCPICRDMVEQGEL